ncbi:hypothetical protein PsorP6_009246 [Peronosclerospora sorghi]|uniref:Uncharacterized protein n=1 Tax=Peronosclerospora sorghi TaxID=230839 RepID=A0ACC0VYB3_9STRA|nr:hypothetical protein PsorP6_009246 [Peronosclerospora sorghi]
MLTTEASKVKQMVDAKNIITDDEANAIRQELWIGLLKTPTINVQKRILFKLLPDDAKDHLKSKFLTFVSEDKERVEQVQKWLKWRDEKYSGKEALDLPAYLNKDRIMNWLLQEAGKSDAFVMPAKEPAITDKAEKFDLTAVLEDYVQEKKLSGLDNVPTLVHLDQARLARLVQEFLMFVYENKNRARQFDGWIQWLNSEPGRKKALAQEITGSTIRPLKRARKE